VGQVRWKIFIQHTILATLPSTYQNLLKWVEILQSSDRKKCTVFLDTVYMVYIENTCKLYVVQTKIFIQRPRMLYSN